MKGSLVRVDMTVKVIEAAVSAVVVDEMVTVRPESVSQEYVDGLMDSDSEYVHAASFV